MAVSSVVLWGEGDRGLNREEDLLKTKRSTRELIRNGV